MLAFDLRMLQASGIGRYLRSLVPRLLEMRPNVRHQLVCDVADLTGRGYAWAHDENVSLTDCRAPIYSLREQAALAAKIERGTELFWSPHYNIPLGYSGRLIVTIHDILHVARPEFVAGIHRRVYAEAMIRAAVRRPAIVLCDSEFTASEVVRHAGAAREKIRVVYPGVERFWFEPDRGPSPLERPYVLAVGNLKPHKNLPRLVEAFELLMDEVGHDLVIIGRKEGFLTGDPRVRSAAARLGSRVRFTGEIDDAALRRYLSHADLLVQPSLYEGFGLPPLEAMACGCPVVSSDAGSLPEVCGDAALYCDPRDHRDIAAKIEAALTDPALRDSLRRKGAVRAQEFTWERCASQTFAAMEEALGSM